MQIFFLLVDKFTTKTSNIPPMRHDASSAHGIQIWLDEALGNCQAPFSIRTVSYVIYLKREELLWD